MFFIKVHICARFEQQKTTLRVIEKKNMVKVNFFIETEATLEEFRHTGNKTNIEFLELR